MNCKFSANFPKRLSAFFFASLIVVGAGVSCTDSGTENSEEVPDTEIVTESSTETSETEDNDYLVDASVPMLSEILPGLDFGGTEIRFMLEGVEAPYIEGYDQGT